MRQTCHAGGFCKHTVAVVHIVSMDVQLLHIGAGCESTEERLDAKRRVSKAGSLRREVHSTWRSVFRERLHACCGGKEGCMQEAAECQIVELLAARKRPE